MAMSFRDDYFEELVRLAGMEDDPLFCEFLNNPLLREKEKWCKRAVRVLKAEVADRVRDYHPFLPGPPSERAGAGNVAVGFIVTGIGPEYLYCFARPDLTQHSLIAGPTGCGKTTLGLHLTIQLHEMGVPVWWFDTEDEVAPVVLGRCGTGDRAPLLIVHEDWRQNIFRGPKNLDALEYITRETSLWRETDYIRDGGVNLARDVCYRLFKQNPYFTLGDVYDELQRMKFRLRGRTAEYWEALVNRLGEKLACLGNIYDVAAGHDLSKLLERSVIWQLRGLSVDHLAWCFNHVLLPVSMCRGVNYESVLQNVFYIDEATRVCSIQRETRTDTGEPFVYDMARTLRKRGIGLCLSTQTPHLLPKPLLSNLGNWVIFRPTDGHYLRLISESLVLNIEQQAGLVRLGKHGSRRVIVRSVRESKPFMVQLPDISFRLATPLELARHRERSRAFLETIREKVERPAPGPPVDESAKADGEKSRSEQKEHPEPYRLSKDEMDYVENVAKQPFLTATERDRRLNVSAGKGSKMRETLVRENYIRVHPVQTGKKGRPIALTELTERGYALLDALSVKYERPRGHGSFVHKFWQHTIHAWAVAQGYPARIEDSGAGGKSVDVGIVWDGRRTAVEVLVEGLEKELSNLLKDLERGWDRVVFCAVDDATLKSLEQRIQQQFGRDLFVESKVSFMRLGRFLE
jgi:hypothetical protein